MKLLIKYATRERPQLFWQTLDNIHSTISTGCHVKSTGELFSNFHIIISADWDDKTMYNKRIEDRIKKYPNTYILYGPPISKVHAINRDIQFAEEWDWLVNMSDDFKFVVSDWDIKMLEQIKFVWGESTDFFAHFNDGYVGARLPTMAIMGRQFYDRFGYVYQSSYGSISCDAEQFHVSRMIGRYHYFNDVYFKHEHPANIPSMEVDQTYRRNDKFGEQDTRNYFDRMSHGFYVENPVFIPDEVREHMERRLQNES